MKRFAVFGSPIIHSFSPPIYHQLFLNNEINGKYNRILTDKSGDVIKYIKEFGLSGANITAPLKNLIIPHLSDISPDSKKINAINTILNYNNKLLGYNTDWNGVLNSLQNYYYLKNKKYDLNYKKILIIGAGNSAAAAIYGIKTFFPKSNIDIINRSIERAKKIAAIYNSNYISEKVNLISLNQYDVIIVTVPNPSEYLSDIQFSPQTILLYSNYTDLDYIKKIKQTNKHLIFGNEWLKEQAISAFEYYNNNNEYYKKVKLTTYKISREFNKLKNKTIFLTGFSGAGKTFIGEKIAKKMNRLFFDLDKKIEEHFNESIVDIFNKKGENIFRNYETKILSQLENKKYVVALGGGTILEPQNLKYIKKGVVVYLYSNLSTSLSRIDISSRPLLSKKTESEIAELYKLRKYIYFDNSDIVIESSNNAVHKIIDEINILNK